MIIKPGYIIVAIMVFFALLATFSSVSACFTPTYNQNYSLDSSNISLNDTNKTTIKQILVVGEDESSYTKSGSKESCNVILKYKLSPASDPHLGGISQVWVDITLYFKNNNTPIPNQIVYMLVGNKKFTYKTNKHGTIKDIFVPEEYGITYFKFLFKGSYIRDKGSKVYLEPVSAYENYLLESQSTSRILIQDSPKNITKNESKNNNQIAYGKMKQTGVPFIQLFLFLVAILGILGFKKHNI